MTSMYMWVRAVLFPLWTIYDGLLLQYSSALVINSLCVHNSYTVIHMGSLLWVHCLQFCLLPQTLFSQKTMPKANKSELFRKWLFSSCNSSCSSIAVVYLETLLVLDYSIGVFMITRPNPHHNHYCTAIPLVVMHPGGTVLSSHIYI
jgi:hypothetical protein